MQKHLYETKNTEKNEDLIKSIKSRLTDFNKEIEQMPEI